MSRDESRNSGGGPTHSVFAIVDAREEGGKSRFIEIGAGWIKRDREVGDTLTIELDREPLAWRDPSARRRLAVRERRSRG